MLCEAWWLVVSYQRQRWNVAGTRVWRHGLKKCLLFPPLRKHSFRSSISKSLHDLQWTKTQTMIMDCSEVMGRCDIANTIFSKNNLVLAFICSLIKWKMFVHNNVNRVFITYCSITCYSSCKTIRLSPLNYPNNDGVLALFLVLLACFSVQIVWITVIYLV